MKLSYKTIKTAIDPVLFKDKKSKFYGYAFPISSEEEVKPILEDLKKLHPTANHFCYAWQLGIETLSYRANDDGEPSNSAGMPIYGQIVSNDLTHILIVVARVFGGTKLGVGGLINAYKNTAMEAIASSRIIEREIMHTLEIRFPYALLNKVMYVIKKNDLKIVSQDSKFECCYTLKVPLRKYKQIKESFTALYELNFKCLDC